MQCISHIIDTNRALWLLGIARRILRSNCRTVAHCESGGGVCNEADDIDGWIVNGATLN